MIGQDRMELDEYFVWFYIMEIEFLFLSTVIAPSSMTEMWGRAV